MSRTDVRDGLGDDHLGSRRIQVNVLLSRSDWSEMKRSLDDDLVER